MTSRDYLDATRPSWFSAHSVSASQLVGTVSLDEDIDAVVHNFDLSIDLDGGMRVREALPGTKLPAYCPERHINADASFCLGMEMTNTILSEESAEIWWASLREFLELQVVAAQTGIWPKAIELDHGHAGIHHAKALEIAAALGIEREYDEARLGKPSWITDGSVRVSRKEARLLNGRARCPLGCRHRSGHPKLRRACSHSTTIAALIHAERQRQEMLEQFWQEQKKLELPCCRSISTCPLRQQKL